MRQKMDIRKKKRKRDSIIIIKKKKGSITLSSEFDKKQAYDFSHVIEWRRR